MSATSTPATPKVAKTKATKTPAEVESGDTDRIMELFVAAARVDLESEYEPDEKNPLYTSYEYLTKKTEAEQKADPRKKYSSCNPALRLVFGRVFHRMVEEVGNLSPEAISRIISIVLTAEENQKILIAAKGIPDEQTSMMNAALAPLRMKALALEADRANDYSLIKWIVEVVDRVKLGETLGNVSDPTKHFKTKAALILEKVDKTTIVSTVVGGLFETFMKVFARDNAIDLSVNYVSTTPVSYKQFLMRNSIPDIALQHLMEVVPEAKPKKAPVKKAKAATTTTPAVAAAVANV